MTSGRTTVRSVCMKIDVEGHELAVLKGAQRLLGRKLIRNIVFEDFGGCESESMRLLRGSGYTIWQIACELLGPRLLPPGARRQAPWLPVELLGLARSRECSRTCPGERMAGLAHGERQRPPMSSPARPTNLLIYSALSGRRSEAWKRTRGCSRKGWGRHACSRPLLSPRLHTPAPAPDWKFRLLRAPGFRRLWKLVRAADVVLIAGPALAPMALATLAKSPLSSSTMAIRRFARMACC